MTDTLGPYELRGELGRGAMAIVWRAFDTRLEREVAVKEPMLPAGIDEATASEMGARFVREGKAAAGLNHPGIVTIYAADVYEGRPAIVMELIEGETLSDTLSRGALPPGAALAITDQLLDAAGYAHARGVVHRDIKPDNVFVTNDGRVKLADFGIAHVGTTAALTQAGTVMGTPGYMAPEQVTGQATDARADLFAIGVLAYEMLVGANPFGATDGVAPTTVMYRIVHEPLPALPQVVLQGLPPHLTAVLATATAKDPAARFPDAQAFRASLSGAPIVTSGSPVPTGAWNPVASTMVATQPQAKTNMTPYIIVGAVMVVVLGLLAVFASGGPSGGSAVADTTAESTAAAESETRQVVERWRTAWEGKDFAGYMAFYAPTFYSQYKQMDRTQWEQYKAALFAKYAYQRVEVSDLTVRVQGERATVEFTQAFTSDTFSDRGSKALTLERSGGTWLITGEEFSAQ